MLARTWARTQKDPDRMTNPVTQFFRTRAHQYMLRRWNAAAREAETADLFDLRDIGLRAKQMRDRADRVSHIADRRLAMPRVGSNAILNPVGSDWAVRPELWSGPITPKGLVAAKNKSPLGRSVTLFHDCPLSEVTMRQVRNMHESDLAPYGLRMDVFRFEGSFLSLVLDVPKDGLAGLQRRHILRVDTRIETEKPLEVFARLNIKHGPNVEQVVRELPMKKDGPAVEFDLAHTGISE